MKFCYTLYVAILLLCIFASAIDCAVDESSWLAFRSAGGQDNGGAPSSRSLGNSECPARRICHKLHRIAIRCDTVWPSRACGSCLSGFVDADDTSSSCVSEGNAADDRIVDTEIRGQPLSDSKLQLSQRADPGNASAIRSPSPKPYPANDDFIFYLIVGSTTAAGLLAIIIAALCWYKHTSASKLADLDYNGPANAEENGSYGDRKLAHSAQMYHYQHQKQQMIAMEKSNGEMKRSPSEADSDLENEEADYTVYECPGLASTGEMEVRNPLFKETGGPVTDGNKPAN